MKHLTIGTCEIKTSLCAEFSDWYMYACVVESFVQVHLLFLLFQIACNAVTALIQYFLLSAFCWMMCEGVMLYLMLVVVFSRLSRKWWFFMLLGWG